MGQDVLSPHLAKLGLTVNTAVLPGGKDSPQIRHLCGPTLCEQSWIEGEALAGPLLLPEI